MEQCLSLEANDSSARQEIVHILRKQKIHYPLQMNASYVNSEPQQYSLRPSTYLLMIYFNIVFPSTPRSSKWSLSLGFLHQYSVYISSLPSMYYMPHPSHS